MYVNSRPHRGHGCSTRAAGIVGASAIDAACGAAATLGGMYGSTTIGLDGCGSTTGRTVDDMTGGTSRGISRRGMSGIILGAAVMSLGGVFTGSAIGSLGVGVVVGTGGLGATGASSTGEAWAWTGAAGSGSFFASCSSR